MHFLTDKYFIQYKRDAESLLRNFHERLQNVDFKHLLESSAVFSSNIEGNPHR